MIPVVAYDDASADDDSYDDVPQTHLDDDSYEEFLNREFDGRGRLRGAPPVGLWIAILIHVLCYGVGAAVGVGLSVSMLLVRKRTQDLGILGAVMTIFGGFGQLLFYFIGSQVGIPFSDTPPYHLVLFGIIGTSGSLWRASVFPHR